VPRPAEAAAALDAICRSNGAALEPVLESLDAVEATIEAARGRYGFLMHVAPDPELRAAAEECERELADFESSLTLREDLFALLRSLRPGSEPASASGRLLAHWLRDSRRAGVELPPGRRERIGWLRERLAELTTAYQRNLAEYEDAISVTREQLQGLPPAYVDGLEVVDAGPMPRYRVSLAAPELRPFLELAEDDRLRRELFAKNHRKAAPQNIAVLEETLEIRDELASTLGYASWADYMLRIRMASSLDAVTRFLEDLERRVQPKAELDRALLEQSATARGPGHSVEFADWIFYAQRVREQQFDIDPSVVAEYFPLEGVLSGAFQLCERLFGVRFERLSGHGAWHPEVRSYAIVESGREELRGHLLLDLHPRAGKFGQAATFGLRSGRRLADGSYQLPAAAVLAQLPVPTGDRPALLRHDDVISLLHELGHALHMTLTESRFLHFAGMRVERDFAEVPSKMLERWCWEPRMLAALSGHHRGGEPLPPPLIERLVASRQVASGIAALRQIYLARLDLAYHGPGGHSDTDAIARELHSITGFEFVEGSHFQAGFPHLMLYDAGYYGYLWSEFLGADMHTRFTAPDADEELVGRQFRSAILARGGTADGSEMAREFLGRDPSDQPFMRDLGIAG
jgi:Zn-dependent oligopeptidase